MRPRLREVSSRRLHGDDNITTARPAAPAPALGLLGMLHFTAPCIRLAVVAAIVIFSGGCITPIGLRGLEIATSDPADAAASDSVDVLSAYAAAKQSLVGSAERSVIKPRVNANRVAFTATQIEAADPPAILEPEALPELLPISPPRAELNPLAISAQQPETGQLGTQQRIKSIRQISLDIRPPQLVNDQQQIMLPPLDEAATALPLMAQQQPFTRGDLAQSGYHWQPTPEGLVFCYQPLYFQEVNVERYGRSFGMFQPVVSVVSFYGRVPLLPYMAFARPARRCTCPPHWALPGYRIPEWERHELVPSVAGGAAEAAAIAGLILLIP
jgi:hypothetical protein